MRWQLIEDGAFLEVPDEHLSILGGRGQVPVALADIYIGNDVLMAVEGCLEREGIFIPDFQNSI
jgi:hypothetical protein